MSDFNEEDFNKRMEEKELKEKEEAVLQADPNNPSTWSNEMIVDYFFWMLKKKGGENVEDVVEMLIDRLKESGF